MLKKELDLLLWIMDKNDKWILASQLQKSVRRGLVDTALEAAEHLYNVDRAYFAYRLGVVILEDMASASPYLSALDGENPWGARRFDTKKNEEELSRWLEAVRLCTQAEKSSLACEMQHCAWWLQDFENLHGPWLQVSEQQALDGMMDNNKLWWERALFSWAGAGTKQYKSNILPEREGSPDWQHTWESLSSFSDIRPFIDEIGKKHVEAHTVFLPLARQMLEKNASREEKPLASPKVHGWLAAALDKHTREGLSALKEYCRLNIQQGAKDLGPKRMEILGTLLFWTEGGALSIERTSPEAENIKKDIRKKWLGYHNLNGRELFDTWYKPELLFQAKQHALSGSVWDKGSSLSKKCNI